MIDLHCHMLPGIDDGSKDVAMSLEMITRSVEQGVSGIVFTPHFYADIDSPDHFLKARDEALSKLTDEFDRLPQIPVYTVGAEVHYFRGMSRVDDLERLCIGNSNFILIEMPFRPWQPQMIDELEEISEVVGLNVIVAHFERYFDQDKHLLARISGNPDLIIQSNAEFFIERKTTRKATKMLSKGIIDVIGSDSHNLDSRRPNLDEAAAIIAKKCGEDALSDLISRGQQILESAL